MSASQEIKANEDFNQNASSLQNTADDSVMAELLSIRRTIDNLDASLVYILAERFRATQKVGLLKAEHSLPAGDPKREEEQIRRLRSFAEAAELDPEFAENVLNFIIYEVIKHHEQIAREAAN